MAKSDYYLVKVKRKSGVYFAMRMQVDNKDKQFSIDELCEKYGFASIKDGHVTKKSDAHAIAKRHFSELAKEERLDSEMGFCEYAEKYWDFDGERITLLNKRKANTINRDYAEVQKRNIKKYVKPYIRKDATIKNITQADIDDVMRQVMENHDLAKSTLDKIQRSMTTTLKDAYKKNVIDNDPTKGVDSFVDKGLQKARGIVTQEELKEIINILERMEKTHVLVATAVAASTGMRLGEIRSLKTDDIKLVNHRDAIINVKSSFAKRAGFKSTKGKKERYVPVPRQIAEAMLDLASKSTKDNGLVFWSHVSYTNPISESHIRENFEEAVAEVLERFAGRLGEMVEIDPILKTKIRWGESERRRRNIVFHSLRHFYVTLLRGKVPDDSIRMVAGHESEAMTENYSHINYENVKNIADATVDFVKLTKH